MTEPVQGPLWANDEQRMARGKEIASHPGDIERIGEVEWSVPSQTGFGRHKVWFVADLPRCTRTDFVGRELPCKHIFAVLELRLKYGGQSLAAPVREPPKQYAQHPT